MTITHKNDLIFSLSFLLFRLPWYNRQYLLGKLLHKLCKLDAYLYNPFNNYNEK